MKLSVTSSYGNILVIQTGFVGDMILTSPLLRALRLRMPRAEITLLHAPRTEELVRACPRVNHRIAFDKRGSDRGAGHTLRLAASLRNRGFELVISPHRSIRSGILALATGAERRIGFDHYPCALFYTDVVPYSRWESTFVRRKLRLLEPLGILAEDETLEAYYGAAEAAEAERLLREAGVRGEYAVLALGSAWPTKRWPPERFGELAALLARDGLASVLVGGPADAEAGERALRSGPAADLTAKTGLDVLAAVLARAALFVGADSGTLHLARAAGVPAIALFGPTGPEQFRFDRRVRVIRSAAPCAPCSDHGSRECPLGDWVCMPGIDAERVAREARLLLEGLGRTNETETGGRRHA